ncbi:MAG TPA: SCO family protein [Candidatus Binatia bacterium]|jgi:protein SCO1/2|nr:SCO family protein [Candidatus Binatia bacterium]
MILGCSNKLLLGLLFLVLLPVDLHAHVPGAPREVPPTSATPNTKAPEYVLLNQEGNRFESTKLHGKVVVLNFIFTTCTDVCPLFTANLAELQRTLKNEQSNVFLVSITTDPEVDSPKVLKSYAQRYGADFQNWAFLTGSESQLKQIWKGFDVRVIKKGRGLVQHTSLTTVIDRQGIRRFNFFGEKWPLKDLLRDTSALLEEKPKHNH